MKLVIDKAKIKQIVTTFVWGKSKRKGYKILLSAPYDNREDLDQKYHDMYATVFSDELMDVIDENVGSDIEFSFKAVPSYRKIQSKKYIDRVTGEPAIIATWDFTLKQILNVSTKTSDRADAAIDTDLPTLEDIFED